MGRRGQHDKSMHSVLEDDNGNGQLTPCYIHTDHADWRVRGGKHAPLCASKTPNHDDGVYSNWVQWELTEGFHKWPPSELEQVRDIDKNACHWSCLTKERHHSRGLPRPAYGNNRTPGEENPHSKKWDGRRSIRSTVRLDQKAVANWDPLLYLQVSPGYKVSLAMNVVKEIMGEAAPLTDAVRQFFCVIT